MITNWKNSNEVRCPVQYELNYINCATDVITIAIIAKTMAFTYMWASASALFLLS